MSGPHGWSEGGLCARSPPPPPRAPRACASPLGSCPRRFSADFGWDDVEVRQKLWSERRQGRTLGASREAPRRCGGDSGKVNRSLPGAHRAERCPVGAADLGHRRGRRLVCVLDLLFLLFLFDLAVRSEGDDGGDARVLLPHRAHASGVSAGSIHVVSGRSFFRRPKLIFEGYLLLTLRPLPVDVSLTRPARFSRPCTVTRVRPAV